MLWFLIILFAAMAIVFFMGKGSFLIAGYNNSSEKQKAMYDEKKLCQVMGVGMGVTSVSMLIAQLFEDFASYSIMAGVIIGLIVIFGGSYFYAKKKDYEYEWIEDKKKEKVIWYKNIHVYTTGITIVVLIVVGFMLFTGGVNVELNDKSLTASASMASSTTVSYTDIEKVEYQSNIDIGSRTWGVGSFRLQAGNFKNEKFGKYKLYTYTNCHDYIVLKTKDGYVVFNDKTEEKTKELYDKLNEVKRINK